MLALAGVRGGYGETRVLFDISFRVSIGEVVALLGRNGMGKTTTIRTIMGLLPARDGVITVDGRLDFGPAAVPHRPAWHRLGARRAAGVSRH